jgi:YVTN family beta-propeller protein
MTLKLDSAHGWQALGAALLLAAPTLGAGPAALPYLHAPSVETYARHDPAGRTILSNGRFLKPAGRHFAVAQWPHGLAMSRDGATLFVASAGTGQFIKNWRSSAPDIQTIQPPPKGREKRRWNSAGADFSADGQWLYWSSGDGGSINVFSTLTGRPVSDIPLNVEVGGAKYEDSFVVDVKTSPDGNWLYCADVANFRVVVVDAEKRGVVGSVRVGRYPYALATAGDHVYVANIGLFEYSPVPPPEDKKSDPRGLTIPPFGYPSAEARDGLYFEGRRIPGLGEANVPESFSVWGLNVADPPHPRIGSRIKTGLLVGAPSDNGKTVGGSAPNILAVGGEGLFVSNGNNDII